MYWSNLDHQEKFPGDTFFAYKVQANSPLHGWRCDESFVKGKKPGFPPIRVLGAELKYRIFLLGPHPEWTHTFKHGDRALQIRREIGAWLTRFRWAILDLPWYLEFALSTVGDTVAERYHEARGRPLIRRYPRELTIAITEEDVEVAWKSHQAGRSVDLPREMHALSKQERNVLHKQVVIQAVVRQLCLNIPWLECSFFEGFEPGETGLGSMVRKGIFIRVSRSRRELARYLAPWDAFVGWTDPLKWAGKKVMLIDTPLPLAQTEATGIKIP